jgi:hypothetical protein
MYLSVYMIFTSARGAFTIYATSTVLRIRMIRQRMLVCLAVGVLTCGALGRADAQAPACQYFKVRANTANVSKEPRADSIFIDLLDKGDIVCVTRSQKAGAIDLAYIPYKLSTPGKHTTVEGWVDRAVLQQLSPDEVAAATGEAAPQTAGAGASTTPGAAPSASTPSAQTTAPGSQDEVLRFSKPIPFGPYPVAGNSIEQLAAGIPMFPPLEGLDESQWKKSCSNCHKWDHSTLCAQGTTYAKSPQLILRKPHPYGGAFKDALMQWAKSGCQ